MDEESSVGCIDGERNPISISEETDQRTKRHKTLTAQDRISALPDSILLDILSSLPTKDAIKTGVLSKRWTSLWTSVPSLSFSDDSFANYDVFATAVDATLAQHTAPKLTKFFVKFKYHSQLNPRLDAWVRFATAAKVDQLSITCFRDLEKKFRIYVLPQHLYANEFVSELNIFSCIIKPNGLIRWSSLKRLNIRISPLGEDALKKMLMGSPSLEYLEFCTCFRPSWLDIVPKSLRKLVINKGFTMGRVVRSSRKMGRVPVFVLEMEIVAPKLESFEIVGNFKRLKCRMKYMAALVKAKLDFELWIGNELGEEDACKMYQDTEKQFLESMHHVKELTLGRWCLKVRGPGSFEPTGLLLEPPLDLPGIASLLQSSPYVETLVIDIESSHRPILEFLEKHYLSSCNYDDVSHGKSTETYFNSLLLCLTTVKIFGFEKRLFHIIKGSIHFNGKVSTQECKGAREDGYEILQVTQKLLSFLRSSPHAMVMFTNFPHQKNDL